MDISLYEFLLIVLFGFLGSLVNCILFKKGFEAPHIEKNPEGFTTYNPGCLGPMFLGIIASYLVWAFVVGDMHDEKYISAILLISGIGGASVITGILQRYQVLFGAEKEKALKDIAQEAINNYSVYKDAYAEYRDAYIKIKEAYIKLKDKID